MNCSPQNTRRSEAFDTPLECEHCGAKVPPSAAVGFEGSDYVWNFCGHGCLAAWCERFEKRPPVPCQR
jgi:hypothetical protein